MKNLIKVVLLILVMITGSEPQGFDLPSQGVQKFSLKDSTGRNQALFFSEARYENVTGLANDVWGEISFDVKDILSTLQGEISISTTSIKTGIKLRDEQLQSVMWLYSEKYPFITFRIRKVNSVDLIEPNYVKVMVTGDFTLHGQTRPVYATAKIKYIAENEYTKSIRPGNLVNISARFNIKLSDFKVNNSFIGDRVSDDILITASLIGSDAEINK